MKKTLKTLRTKPRRGAEVGFTVAQVRTAFTKAERKRAAKHLSDVVKWFGPKGERWVQHDYTHASKGEPVKACLIGAMEKVDGPYAYAAQQMLLAVMPKRENMFGDNEYSTVEDFNDFSTTTFAGIQRLVAKAQKALLA